MAKSSPRILVIRTDFSHHGERSGYKQLLKFIHPVVVLGVNERTAEHTLGMRSRYQWLFELDIRRYRKEIDIVHIFYGEDYLRFSPVLYPDLPIVATFHQPASMLEEEVSSGSLRGRMGQLTHRLSRSRFSKLAAAIVTEASQKKVLARVMPADRIHIIPLGVHLDSFREVYQAFSASSEPVHPTRIVTVGNWLRDWDLYERTLQLAATHHPTWEFHLVNRRLGDDVRKRLHSFHNLQIHAEISDDELRQLLYSSRLQFIPVTAASGNNALLEAMAMGCPVVMTDVFQDSFLIGEPEVRLHSKGDPQSAISRIGEVIDLDESSYSALKASTFARASEFDWKEIARRTQEVYQQVCNV